MSIGALNQFETDLGKICFAIGQLIERYNSSAAKAWATIAVSSTTTDMTILQSSNVTSVTRSGTGAFTVSLREAMSGTAYAVVPGVQNTATTAMAAQVGTSMSAGAFTISVRSGTAAADPAGLSFVVYGAQ